MNIQNNDNNINLNEIPQGLGMALARNLDAMTIFSQMSENERRDFIEGARKVKSRKEMKQYVTSLKDRTNELF